MINMMSLRAAPADGEPDLFDPDCHAVALRERRTRSCVVLILISRMRRR